MAKRTVTTSIHEAPVYVRLRKYKSEILQRWTQRARQEIAAAFGHDDPVLKNHFPQFLDKLVSALNPSSDDTNASEGNALSTEHGIQRAQIGNYTLDQVISEYNLLQDVVFNRLLETGPVSVSDSVIISRSFIGAVRSAASVFVAHTYEQHFESEMQFKRLVEDAKDVAIFIVDTDGIIRTWNQGAARIKLFKAEEVIGHHYRMLFREEDRSAGRPEHNLKVALANERHEEQWWRIKKDGTHWWAEAILSAVRSPSGKIIGVAKIVRDLTEKRNSDEQLKKATEAAEAASALKSTFVANMSHEIRTPLGAILGYSKLLESTDLSADDRSKFTQVIDRNGKVLLRLIDDILDISKIEAGKLEVENVPVSIRTAVPEIVALFELKAKEKGLEMEMDISTDAPEYITTDPVRFRQILGNLLGNAVKFTTSGRVHVLVEPAGEKAQSGGLEIFVVDTGPGIAKENRSRIFSEFSQEDPSITRKFGGTGLGLALSRKLARELGGDLELLDCPTSVGCTFKVTIADRGQVQPQSQLDREVRGWKSAQSEDGAFPKLDGCQVLLVEDSEDTQNMVEWILRKVGAKVEVANNGAEAVRKAMDGDFDIILMDVQMPIMDGYSATSKLRSQGYNTPIVALTAHAMIEDRIKAINSGCNDYLTKPIESKELLNLMGRWAVRNS